MLALTIFLSHNLAVHLYDAEETIKNILFVKISPKMRKIEEAEETIQLELYRSRRNKKPLSLMIVDLDERSSEAALNRTIDEVQQSVRKHYLAVSLARSVSSMLRRTDMLLEQPEHNRFVLLCPETDISEVEKLENRIKQIAEHDLNITACIGSSTFPDDALTFDELLKKATKNMEPISIPQDVLVVD
jgi:GGDEF domain-containing protein